MPVKVGINGLDASDGIFFARRSAIRKSRS